MNRTLVYNSHSYRDLPKDLLRLVALVPNWLSQPFYFRCVYETKLRDCGKVVYYYTWAGTGVYETKPLEKWDGWYKVASGIPHANDLAWKCNINTV